jgi:Na+/melibiose symporter-like transporter
MLESARTRRFVIAYGAAHGGKSLFWYCGEVLFAYFLTEVAGLPPVAMGFVLAAGLAASAVMDLIVGSLFKQGLSQAQSAGRLQRTGAILSAISLFAFFATPFAALDWRLAVALGASLLLRATYAIYEVSQNALLSLATANSLERTRLAGVRIWASGLATLLIALALGPLVAEAKADRGHVAFLAFAAGIALVGAGSAIVLARCVPQDAQDDQAPPRLGVGGFAILAPLGVSFAMHFLHAGPTSLFTRLEPYFTAYVLASPTWGGAVVVAVALGWIISQPAWIFLGTRFDRGAMIALSSAASMGAAGGFMIASADAGIALLAMGFAFGAAHSGMALTLWSGFADAVASRARAAAGLAYGAFTASAKLSLAIAALSLGLWLSETDFREASRGYITYPMTLGPIMAAGAVLAVAALFGRRDRFWNQQRNS